MYKFSGVPVALYPMRSHYLGLCEDLEDNGDAHLKRSLIHYAEFDGQRRKRVVLKVIGEEPPEAAIIWLAAVYRYD
jgi:thiamine phosphate synthase YjbQ (UPF0047 family)